MNPEYPPRLLLPRDPSLIRPVFVLASHSSMQAWSDYLSSNLGTEAVFGPISWTLFACC